MNKTLLKKYNDLYKKNQSVWGEDINPLLNTAIWQIKEKKEFLDLGCGQGKEAIFISKLGINATAVDASGEAIKQISKKIKKNKIFNLKTINENIVDYKIKKNKFDIIFANNVLQFINKKDAIKLIKQMQVKIKPKGVIILSAFTVDDPKYDKKNTQRTFFENQEILRLFNKFKIIYYFENLILDKGHGGFRDPHLHGIAQIIAQNSNLL